ncbi:Eukaryotic translation initiation factor 3 subunit H [Micractinium conductrix]|uniref:Eukaryotic translation initiation factor 3 subunit H n=1 Tax=Micractinium conductrix TaxID=554055 RepID=A0A2P6VDT9_9CHLO|nr:Eukaryotic translation initiation factor 3 subunit H [Micractinium conductrix]|eukprot:PSC72242.1 Eukaryotic translation initiation factor 3 subunit H [Micractinium conductrix]
MAAAPISFAAMASKEKVVKEPLNTVQVEGQVILKIAKHCREADAAAIITGQLLGLDVGATLEITDAFPYPGHMGEEQEAGEGGESYQLEMMRCLRDVNADNNTVGWYQSTISGSYQVVEIVETFVSYMASLERCVCLVYDTTAAAGGALGVKAVRLGDSFVQAYREGSLTIEKIRAKGLSWHDVFVEIPVTVHNSHMAAALAAEIAPPSATTALDYERLGLGVAPLLEKNLEFLNDCLDDVMGEQGKLSMYQNNVRRQQQAIAQFKMQRRQDNLVRRAAGEETLSEDPPEGMFKAVAEPNQLDNMLLSNQMASYCQHINTATEQALSKLKLMDGLQAALP